MWKMEQVCVFPAALPLESVYMSIHATSHESVVISDVTAMLPKLLVCSF